MPYTQQAGHASFTGAQVAGKRAPLQKIRMLKRYWECGALTDLQMAAQLRLPESRISARRSQLMTDGFVEPAGIIMGPHGARNTLWKLSAHGLRLAATV